MTVHDVHQGRIACALHDRVFMSAFPCEHEFVITLS